MLFYDLTYSTSRHTEYVSDIGGFIYQHFFYSPFGEALVSQHANSGRYDTEFRFNGKEQDPELQGASKTSYYYQTTHTLQSRIPLKNKQGYEQTGLYYYGARYYNPRYSIWMSVDPLAHEFPSWTPYNYTMNNPINLIDPDGRAALPPEAGEFEDGFVWTDNDGSYTFDGETQTWTPNDENSLWTDWADEVEVTTTLSKHEKTMQNPIVKAVHRAHGDFLRGTAELGAHTLQQTGDVTALAGYGLTLTGVGAPLGIPLAAVGTGMSTVGGGIEASLHLADGNYTEAAVTGAFTLGGRVAPGFIKTKGLGGEILRQSTGLKVSGANRLRKSESW